MKPDIKKMTLRDKIAQTMIVRQSDLLMQANTAYSKPRKSEEAGEIMTANQFSGIWIHGNQDVNGMSKNLNDTFSFTSESYTKWLKSVSAGVKIPLLHANDPAGKTAYSDLSKYLSGIIVGAAGSEELARELGRCVAEESALAGCNWLWGPMSDTICRYATGITRPFSNKTQDLIRLTAAYVDGVQSRGVAATAKHFPGADPTEKRDCHIVTASISASMEEWKKEQGAVFQNLINQGVYAIMAAGRAFPAADDTMKNGRYIPAALSEKILLELLRKEMGFDGIIITDDVTMGCCTSFYGRKDLYAAFLRAGNDVLLGVGIDAVDIVEKSVLKGDLSVARVNDACARVLAFKEKLGLFAAKVEKLRTKEEIFTGTQAVCEKIAQRGITLIRDRRNLLPVSASEIKKVTIICYSQTEDFTKHLSVMKEALQRRGAQVNLQGRLESFEEIEKIAKESDLIVYAAYIGFHAPKGAPSFYGDEFWSLRYAFADGGEKSIGISLGYPHIHHDFMPDADAFVNAYSPHAEVQKAFVAAAYGEIPFLGISPLELEP